MPTTTDTFTGFRPEAIQFLADLAENNERDWFTPRKGEYERLLKEPLAALCVALDERSAARGIPLAGDPARSPFRIYRDVRFSKDKSPYKTNVAASFPWAEGGDARAPRVRRERQPGRLLPHAPGEVYIGGGMWHPPTAKLAAFRNARRRRPGGRSRPHRRAAVRRDVRGDLGRQAEARAGRASRRTIPRPSCSSRRT